MSTANDVTFIEHDKQTIEYNNSLKYFVRGNITVWLTHCFTGLYSVALFTLKVTTYLLVWLNPNYSNKKPAVQ